MVNEITRNKSVYSLHVHASGRTFRNLIFESMISCLQNEDPLLHRLENFQSYVPLTDKSSHSSMIRHRILPKMVPINRTFPAYIQYPNVRKHTCDKLYSESFMTEDLH